MRSLESYLSKIYTDFENEIVHMDKLCVMTSLNYQVQSFPKYADIHVQQLYLLKYAYAYAYEYYLMYNKAVEKLGIWDHVSVLSLGCGAMVDYIGLISLKDIRPLQVSYTGIDQVDWNYKPIICGEDKSPIYLNTNVVAYFRELEELKEDIYIFPKSISELSIEEVKNICEEFSSKKNRKKRFCVCVSLRNSQIHREDDWKKTDMLERAIMAAGYAPDMENKACFIARDNCGIKKLQKNYNYPSQAVETLKGLGERCQAKQFCKRRSWCMECMNRYPVLKTSEVCYRIMTFERRNRV